MIPNYLSAQEIISGKASAFLESKHEDPTFTFKKILKPTCWTWLYPFEIRRDFPNICFFVNFEGQSIFIRQITSLPFPNRLKSIYESTKNQNYSYVAQPLVVSLESF